MLYLAKGHVPQLADEALLVVPGSIHSLDGL